ncbi:MAG: OsmC family protein [Bacteroidales bacterium]|nr:OsmC family protein [Bacteroidales bacterium]
MKDSVSVNWKKGMAFEAEVDGHKILVDAKEEQGGSNKGPRPKPLMMVALAGCTGMDVVSILKKMRVEPDDFNIRIDGELSEEHPKRFTKMHIIYEFTGKDLPMDKLEKAIDLSQERYCGVSVSYKEVMEISHEIKIIP